MKRTKLAGAILGDVVGSIYEFDNIKTKDFPLFDKFCMFTDDTVLTLALAKTLTECDARKDVDGFKKKFVENMHLLGDEYPDAGFGGRFMNWLETGNREPYNSFGNGSAMRVSPVAWYAKSLEEAELLAKASAEVTHNHPEGIKGAVAVAGAIYLARTGAGKKVIREYCEKFYNLDFTLDEIRPAYRFVETCQGSVPQALVAFLESESFEDAIRNAVSIGGDSDTIGAITGSVAEAFYGIDEVLEEKALSYLDERLLKIVEAFHLADM